MKYLIYLIFFLTHSFAAQLTLNRYEENNQSVDIYHLIDSNIISCQQEYGKGFEKIIRCSLSHAVQLDKNHRNDTYFEILFEKNDVIFKAKRYVKILPIDDKLIDKTVVTREKGYHHWVIIGSRYKPEIVEENKRQKFNFPVKYAKKETPYIGALDLNGEPIKNKKSAIYLSKIKKLYGQKKYETILKLIDQYQSHDDNTFYSEIELYKLRVLAGVAKLQREKYEELLGSAIQWIEDNPSNKNIPEVYSYVVKSYLGKGRLKQAEKYLHILTSGFTDNKYTQMAQIFYADTIYKSKKRRKEAQKIYKDVLYATKDLETASVAALKIANSYIDFKEPEKAKKIYAKVLKSNPEFVKENYDESFTLAKRFADNELYDIALDIAYMLEKVKKNTFQDELQKSIGYWEESRGNTEKALQKYTAYLKSFPKGQYKSFVLKHLDTLMIMQSEQNLSKKLSFIDVILQKYEDEEIQKRALEEKAKLLFALGRYDDILKMKEKLHKYKIEKIIKKSAEKIIINALENKQCEKAVVTMRDYNITLPADRYDEEIFTCYTETGMFTEAKKIAEEKIKTDDLHQKLKWLYLSTKLYKKLDQNKKVILAGNDVLKLSKALGEKKYDDILYDIAEAYYNLREYDDLMLKTVKEIEQRFPEDVRNIDLFIKVVHYAQKRKDLMLQINYAKKVIDLKKRYNVTAYSPRIEIQYIHGLQKIGQYKKALAEDKKLLQKTLNDEQKAEVLYLAGELSIALQRKKDAVSYFTRCGEIVQNSNWQKLCAENLELLIE